MCTFSEHIILSQNKNGQISWCKGCRNYLVLYGNCAIAFTHKEINHFKSLLGNVTEADFNIEFDGQRKIMIKNSGAPVGIYLSRDDIDVLNQLTNEALTINDVFQIVY